MAEFNINYNNIFRIFIPDTSLIFRNISGSVINRNADSKINYGANVLGFVYKNIEIDNLRFNLTDSVGIIDLLVNADTCRLVSQPVNNLHLTSHFADWQSLTNLSVIDNHGKLIYDFEIGSANDTANIYLTIPSKQLILNGFKWQLDAPELLKINRTTKALTPNLKMHTGDSFISLTKDENEGEQTYNLELW